MLTPLRRGPADQPRDLRSHLLACHQRIRQFSKTARRLGDPAISPAEAAEACRAVRRYFTVAFPLHAQDEDLSLLPRLVAARPQGDVSRALASMRKEHASIDRALRDAVALWDRALVDEGAWITERSRMGRVGARLEELFDAHLLLEETFIFPALDTLLTPEDKDAIVSEIRARRAQPPGETAPPK
ncbi:hemerythrin domain-containing protein [Polyangium aurulentum]|uniref:hemerythrin domain-containing protein n=1 Tax=Polyangium aurulentum TaxID=2567896 RepID=UPI0010AEDCEF|nr:hemerythrin domain-containing protein [Polyangium aurulentum]UQA57760.1 hemerythrin domain-containing protein [Polyangium aurulentum]